MKLRKSPQQAVSRKSTERLVQTFTGLNTVSPYTQMKDSISPNFYNCRLYARNSTDRRVAVGTRKGPGLYSVALGETVDQQQTSVTGAADQTVTNTAWLGAKFTAGASGRVTKVEFNVKNGVTPTQHMLVAIYSDSSGSPGTLLGTSSILSTDIGATYDYEIARFIEAPLVVSGTSYWAVAYMQAGGAGNYLWSSTTSATTAKTSSNSGGSWSATSFSLNVKTYVSTNSPFLGGTRYTPSNATAKTVIGHGTNVYTVDDATGVTTSIKSGLSASVDYFFDQSNDQLFYTNGVDAPRFWNGTTDAVVAGSPPVSKFCIFHKNRFWVVDVNNPTKLVFSELGDYQTYLSTNFIHAPAPKSGDPVVGLKIFQDNLIVFTRRTKYILFGDDPGNFVLRQSSGRKGAVNQRVIQSDPNYIYYLSDDGVYRFNGSADELISDNVQTEVDSIVDKTKVSAVIQNNYYRLYYEPAGTIVNSGTLLWDTTNKFWLRDSQTYIDKPFVTETNRLIEGSAFVGAIYYAETAYSDLGKPIPFIYWTKYFGDGLHKMFLRRLLPSIRLQTQPYNLNIYIDIDQRNTTPLRYTVSAQASGSLWGGGATTTWGAGTTVLWGSATVSGSNPLQGTEAFWHQIRYEQTGVDTPVEILSYILQLRVRRLE